MVRRDQLWGVVASLRKGTKPRLGVQETLPGGSILYLYYTYTATLKKSESRREGKSVPDIRNFQRQKKV